MKYNKNYVLRKSISAGVPKPTEGIEGDLKICHVSGRYSLYAKTKTTWKLVSNLYDTDALGNISINDLQMPLNGIIEIDKNKIQVSSKSGIAKAKADRLILNENTNITGSLKLDTIAAAGSDTDKFLVSDSGTVKYRTGAQILSDLGISADEIIDWTSDQGDTNIHANNIVITHNQVTDFDTEITSAIDALIDSAPGALNTLNELAAALGDDANFSTTVTNSIATKLPLAGGTMTGDLIIAADNKIKSDTSSSHNFIEFDDDSGSPENQTLISSVTNVVALCDGNNNGTGHFEVLKGGTDSTATELFRVENDGDAVFTGDLYIPGEKKIQFDSADTSIYTNSDNPEDLYIEADEDIYIRPDDNLVIAGGTNNYVTFDGTNQRVGIGTSPQTHLDVFHTSAPEIAITGDADNVGVLGFGDDANYKAGRIEYNHASNFFTMDVAGTERFKLTSSTMTADVDINLTSGHIYKIDGTSVLSNNTLGSGVTSSSLTSVGTISTGTWQATDVAVAHGGTGASSASDARSNLGITYANIGTVDISDNTNLSAGTNITLSGDTLNVDDAFVKNDADDEMAGALTVTKAGDDQLTLAYDSSNKVRFDVSSSGDLAIHASGNDITLSERTDINFGVSTGTTLDVISNAITSGEVTKIQSSSTAWTSGNLLTLTATGDASSGSGQTKTGIDSEISGTAAVNRAGYFKAAGATANYALVTDGGNVGIGTTTPDTLLHVDGDAKITGDLTASGGDILFDALTTAKAVTIKGAEGQGASIELWADEGDETSDKWQIESTTNNALEFYQQTASGWASRLNLVNGGNVVVRDQLLIDDVPAGDGSSEDIMVIDSGDNKVKKRTYAELRSDLGIADNEIIDWTTDQGGTNIHSGNYTDTNTNGLTTFVVEDGDGTEVTISNGKQLKFKESGGININFSDYDSGADGDEFDLSFNVYTAQTSITSILNASLAIGRDADNQIKFDTDNQITFEVDGGDNVLFKTGGEIEASSLDISGDVDVDGTLETDALTIGGVTSVPFESADHSKLDGIEAGATADQTGPEIATLLNTDLGGNFTIGNQSDDMVTFSGAVKAVGTLFAYRQNYPQLALSDDNGTDKMYIGVSDEHAYIEFMDNEGAQAVNTLRFRGDDQTGSGDYSNADVMTVDFVNNRVGINTISPNMALEVVAGANDGILINRNSTSTGSPVEVGFRHTTSAGDASTGMRSYRTNEDTSYDQELRFFTTAGSGGQAEHLTIKHNGKVGIGTTSPTEPLEVYSANSEAYHYPIVARNPYNHVSNLDYGVGIKLQLDDGNENKWAGIIYEADSAYGNSGDLCFYIDGATNTSPKMKLQHEGNLTVTHAGWKGIVIQNTTDNDGSHLELKNTDRRFQVAVRSNGFDIRDVTASDTSRFFINSSGNITTGVWNATPITHDYIGTDAIDGDNIADDSINSEHYVDGSIDTAHIADDQVTYAKIQNVSATNVVLGRDSAGAGVIEEISASALRTILNVADGATANTGDITRVQLQADVAYSGSDVATANSGDADFKISGGGAITTARTSTAGEINIGWAQPTSILATDIKIGEDDETKIDFETADEIHFYAANAEQVYVADGVFGPQTDSDVDLGTSGARFKIAYIDNIVATTLIQTPDLWSSSGVKVADLTNDDITFADDVSVASGTLTFGSLSDGSITATAFVDEDDMSSNSATLIPTQQSVKAYVDSYFYDVKIHQWYAADANQDYIPFGSSNIESNSTADSLNDDTLFIAPYNGTLEKIVLQAAPGSLTVGGAGNTRIQLRVNGSLLTFEQEAVANETSVTFTWTDNNSFNAGDRLRISFDPTNTPKYVTATSVWKYTL